MGYLLVDAPLAAREPPVGRGSDRRQAVPRRAAQQQAAARPPHPGFSSPHLRSRWPVPLPWAQSGRGGVHGDGHDFGARHLTIR